MAAVLVRASTLWVLLALCVLITAAVATVMRAYQLDIIDELSDPRQILSRVAAMTPVQRRAHAWMTGTLDMLFPLAYGLLFMGMALRFFGRAGPLFASAGLAAMVFDFVENVVQVQILTGDDRLVGLKQFVTPAKLICFEAGVALCVIALGVGFGRAFLRGSAARNRNA